MTTMTPFLWFDTEAEDAANFYLSIFPGAKKISELRSNGVGPWPVGAIAIITIELMGQQMTFLDGGPHHKLSEAFSFFIACGTQQEIDFYWNALLEGGGEVQCGWLKDKYGLSWQVAPRNISELIRHPKAMEAMMGMAKLDIAALEAAATS
jgi:predicted 3-demethylubiquinone-9 3-methyltransferase (glyoxalase superfamily)